VSTKARAPSPSQSATAQTATGAALERVLELCAGLLSPTSRRDLEAARSRLHEQRFNLVVLGEFKRGKSTLINALLGRRLLPTGVVPLTSVITTVRHGPRDRLVVRFAEGNADERPLDELAAYATEAGNPGNHRGVEATIVEVDSDLLASGLQLVDTPGIGSVYGHNTEAAEAFLPQVDAALCVLAADQPLSRAEHEFFEQAGGQAPRLLFAVNRVDILSADDGDSAVEFIRGALRQSLGREPELFPVSALHRTGIDSLRDRIGGLANAEQEDLLDRSVRRLASSLASEAAQAARFEANAVAMPLAELERRTALFRQRSQALRSARDEARDLLDRNVARALQQLVNEPLMTYAQERGPALAEQLRGFVADRSDLAPRALAGELDSWIDEAVRREFSEAVPRFEQAIGKEVAALQARYGERIEEVLADIERMAKDVFGSAPGGRLSATGVDTPSRFSFKLHDPEHALDRIVAAGHRWTPGRVGRRLVARAAEERLLAMTDRHAGRLRSELAERVRDAVRDYERRLTAVIDEALAAIRSAVERATREHDRDRGDVGRRVGELEQRARELESLSGAMSDEKRGTA
jgi:GTP-binding protein EngB required for normal cell division